MAKKEIGKKAEHTYGRKLPSWLLRALRVIFSALLTLVILSQIIFWSAIFWLKSSGGQEWLKTQIAAALENSGYHATLGSIGAGFGGHFRLGTLQLNDSRGRLLEARDVDLGIGLPALLSHNLSLTFSASELFVYRMPEAAQTQSKPRPVFAWPEKYFNVLSLDKVHIDRLVFGPELAGAAMEISLDADLKARPMNGDISFDLTLRPEATAIMGLPETFKLSAVYSPASGELAVTGFEATSALYQVSGEGSLGTGADAPLKLELRAHSADVPGVDGVAKASISLTGTLRRPDLKISGSFQPQGATAEDLDNVRFNARLDGQGRGRIEARTAYQKKPASADVTIAFAGATVKLSDIKIAAAGISAGGRAEIALEDGFKSAQLSLRKLRMGNIAFDELSGRISRVREPGNYSVALQLKSGGKRRLDVSGTAGLGLATLPVNLAIKADRLESFRTIQEIEGVFSGDLAITGSRALYKIGGMVTSPKITITVPDRLNASIPKLNIVSGSKRGAASSPDMMKSVALEVHAIAKRRVYVRGRGLDAEFGGDVMVTGTLAVPLFNGIFESLRGRYEAFGKRLTLSRARLSFMGPIPPSPYLDVLAQADAGDIVAQIALTGGVDKPAVELSSVPKLPADEVLSRLLFGKELSRISPFQAIQLANALRQFTGAGGGGLEPLSLLRKATGLDDLQINTDKDGTTGIGAGKYISDKVYIEGASGQNGNSGAAKVRIEITPNLKAESKIGPGEGSGGSIFWQKDY